MTTIDKLFADLSAAPGKKAQWDAGITFNRTNAVPLDNSSVFKSYFEAVAYATRTEDVVAYPGQLVTVNTAAGVDVYVLDPIEPDGLRKLASGGDASSIETKLNNEISARKANDTYLSSEISTLQTTTLPTLSSTLNQNLSIDVAVEAGTDDGVLSTYTISQGGVAKTVKINIPKDKVVEKAEVVKDPAGKDPGTYLKLTIANVAEPIYVPVPELVNTYSGLTSDTVNVFVGDGSAEEGYKISATVKTGSIGAEHFTDSLSTYVKGIETSVGTLETTLTGVINTVSVALSNDYVAKDAGVYTSALTDAKAYTDSVSTALSTDYVEKISKIGENSLSAAKAYTDSVSAALSTDYVAKDEAVLTSAKAYIDSVSAALSTDYVAKDEAVLTAAKGYTDSVSTALSTDYVEKINKIGENSLSAAKAYTNEVSTLIKSDYEAADGATYTSAVTYVNSVSTALSNDYVAKDAAAYTSALADAKTYTDSVSTALSTDYVEKITSVDTYFKNIVNTTGLSAANADDLVVTWSTISDLAGSGMHFRGVTTADLSTGSTTVPVPPYAAGQTPSSGDIVINTATSKEFIWVTTSTTSSWHELGDEGLYMKKSDFETWRDTTYENRVSSIEDRATALETDVASLKLISADLSDYIETLSTDLADEIERATGVEDELSTAIKNKVMVGDYGQNLSAVESLSVVHIGADEYHQLVKLSSVDPTTLYVVSSDAMNLYGEKIINLAEPTLSNDAATKNYVDTVSAALSTDYVQKIEAAKTEIVGNALSGVKINDVDATVEGNVAMFDISCICGGGADPE